jgi:hypothetical protein
MARSERPSARELNQVEAECMEKTLLIFGRDFGLGKHRISRNLACTAALP